VSARRVGDDLGVDQVRNDFAGLIDKVRISAARMPAAEVEALCNEQ
jgi:hypothetical protein